MDQLHEKYENLKAYLKSLGSVAVAFSSGVDSTFLLDRIRRIDAIFANMSCLRRFGILPKRMG